MPIRLGKEEEDVPIRRLLEGMRTATRYCALHVPFPASAAGSSLRALSDMGMMVYDDLKPQDKHDCRFHDAAGERGTSAAAWP